jgi:hypothetical protein
MTKVLKERRQAGDDDPAVPVIAGIIRERFELGLDDSTAEAVARKIIREVPSLGRCRARTASDP